MRNSDGYIDLILAVTMGRKENNEIVLDEKLSEEGMNQIDRFLDSLGNAPVCGRAYAQLLNLKFGLKEERLTHKKMGDLFGVSAQSIQKQIERLLKRLRNQEIRFFYQFSLGHKDKLEKAITLDDLIDRFFLTERANAALSKSGVKTVGDLIGQTEAELLRITNFRRKNLEEVKKALKEHNLALRE